MSTLHHALVSDWRTRSDLHEASAQTAYRIFHGRSEGFEGMDVERYGGVVVAYAYQDVSEHYPDMVATYRELMSPSAVVVKERWRKDGSEEARAGKLLSGSRPQAPIEVLDNGIKLWVEPAAAQNTGLFLDARPARAWLMARREKGLLLNLFCYTGSLGLAASLAGARGVTHVDQQRAQLRRVKANYQLNGMRIDDRDLVRADCWDVLRRAAARKGRWSGIILDPPPLLDRRTRERREDRYDEMACLAARCLAGEGWLMCFFSRSSSGEDPARAVLTGLRAEGHEVSIACEGVSGEDYPEAIAHDKLRFVVYDVIQAGPS